MKTQLAMFTLYPSTQELSEIFDTDILPIDFCNDSPINFHEPHNQEQCLISSVQYKAAEFPDKLKLIVHFFAHFFLELFDGVSIEVVEEERDSILVDEVLMRIRIFY
jgi:hypothetical protein